MEIYRFGTGDAVNILQKEPDRLDRLPYGAIQLDRAGVVLKFNRAEEMSTGLLRDEVVGRNFFQDVAPCSRSQPVFKHFQRFLAGDRVDAVMRYAIALPDRSFDVKAHLRSQGDVCWLFMKRA